MSYNSAEACFSGAYLEAGQCPCGKRIIRRRAGSAGKIYCDDCLRERRRESNRRTRKLRKYPRKKAAPAPDPEAPPLRIDPQDPLMLLIRAGWGSVPQPAIPADVRADAAAGRMPRSKV